MDKRIKLKWAYQTLILVILIALLVFSPASAQETIVSIANVEAEYGSTITVPLRINNVTSLGGGEVSVTYDPSVVHVTGVTEGNMTLTAYNINNASGWVYMNAISASGQSGDVVFANINLTAVGNEAEVSPLNITVDDLFEKDYPYPDIPHTTIDGTFYITSTASAQQLTTPFMIYGHVFYGDNSDCNNPEVNVTNLNTGEKWQAGTNATYNYYQLILANGTDLIAGVVLRFDVTSPDGSQSNTTNHTVTLEEINNGGLFDFDFTFGAPAAPKVAINEFVSKPTSPNPEWIELYNPTGGDVSLDGWTVGDGSGATASLNGKTVPAHSYLILNRSAGDFSFPLNNPGDIIYLNTSTSTVDKVAYGNWDDGNTDDNAPAPGYDKSTGRYPNGVDTDNDSADFRVFEDPTPGAPNTIDTTPPQWSNPQTNKTQIYQNEYVKFTANWTDNVGLAGYIFSINQSGTWGNSSFTGFNGTSNVSQNITLITAPAGTTVEWRFFANDTSDNWNVTDVQSFVVQSAAVITPAAPFMTSGWVNYSSGSPVNNPNVTITNLNTSNKWQAETHPGYNFYQLVLDTTNVSVSNVLEFNATDGTQYNITSHTVTQSDINNGGLFVFNITLVSAYTYDIVINEFMPNPVGADDAPMPGGEWVELRNLGDADVNASGWVLYDSDDAHELYITSTNTDTGNTIVPANGWLVVYRNADSDFSLNQDADEVRLYDGYPVAESNLIDRTNYTYSHENISWARIPDGTGAFKESEPTPKKTNEIYRVSVTAEPMNQTVYQSENATYSLTITNLGNVADTIKLNITENEADFDALSADTFSLNASENATAYLNVSDSNVGIYNTTVRATSQGNTSVFDGVTVKTNVTALPTTSAPATPFMIYGWILYENGAPCNNPGVNVTNLNTSEKWQADSQTSSNYYRIILATDTDVNAGEVLRFNVTSPDGNQSNISEHTVTLEELNNGGFFNFNFTSGVTSPTLVEYTISNRTITPPQTTDIDVKFSEKVGWKIAIENGGAVYDWTGTSTDPNKKTWDGTYKENDTIMPDGAYIVNITWTNTTTDLGGQNNTETITVSKPPASITDLANTTYQETYINWTWTDPEDTDFSKVMVYLDGTLKTNVTKGTQFYNATGLTADTEYEIATRTVDNAGNINDTWKNDTARTAIPPEPETLYLIYGWVFYKNGTACDNPVVNITNSNMSKQWQAETNVNHSYYQLILDTTNISAGNVLEFNASGCSQANTTEHTVMQAEIDDGGMFNFNITLASPAAPPTPVEDTEPPVAVAEPSHQTVNMNETAYFNGSLSTDNVGIVNCYEWDFGDGTNATGQTASHPYPTAGLYTVTLTVHDAANNSDTDTCSVSVLLPPIEQTNPYNVTDTPTDDGNNVTINGADIRGAEPLNDMVSIVLDTGTLVINIAVNVTDNTTGTVASVILDTPMVVVSSNRTADIDLNLNSSVWAGGCPVLTTQPFYDLNDTVSGWNGTAVGATATNAVTLAMSGLGLSVSDSGTAIMVHVNLSGINESDVLSLPINMTVDGDWYRDAADSTLTNVYLFKLYPNGTIKEQENPTGHHYDAANDTYTFYFEMPGFSTFVLVGGKSSSPSTSTGSRRGGDGTYPPTPAPPPAIASAAGTPVEEGTAAEAPTPEQVMESRTEQPSLPPPISSPTAGIVIVAVAAIFGIVMVIRAAEDRKKATIVTIGIVIVAVAATIGMMLM